MPVALDLDGRQFGRLTVLRKVPTQPGSGGACWECLCVCGKTHITRSAYLTKGKTRSCGCIQKDRRDLAKLHPGESGFRRLHFAYQKRAKSSGLEWRLTEAEFRALTQGNCQYCGTTPTYLRSGGCPRNSASTIENAVYRYNGVDRLDNDGGYVPGNVVTCCGTCNFAKRDMRLDAFIAWGKRLGAHLQRGIEG
jgi:hypothetical protein